MWVKLAKFEHNNNLLEPLKPVPDLKLMEIMEMFVLLMLHLSVPEDLWVGEDPQLWLYEILVPPPTLLRLWRNRKNMTDIQAVNIWLSLCFFGLCLPFKCF